VWTPNPVNIRGGRIRLVCVGAGDGAEVNCLGVEKNADKFENKFE
jgi:hypothetical protein